MDSGHRRYGDRRAVADELQLRHQLHRLLQLCRRLHAGICRPRRLQGPDHPPPAVAGRSRLQRQESRGDRQRRHRRHPGTGDDRQGWPRHHAAALPHLCGQRAAGRQDFQQPAPLLAGDPGLPSGTDPQCGLHPGLLSPGQDPAESHPPSAAIPSQAPAGPQRRHATLDPQVQSLG